MAGAEPNTNPALGIALTPFDIDIISSKTAMTGGFYHRGGALLGKKEEVIEPAQAAARERSFSPPFKQL